MLEMHTINPRPGELVLLPTRQFMTRGYVTPAHAGLDKEIQELMEAVVLPMTHKHMFDSIGIRPPKGILLHGPPGTGKTLLARACAKQTDAIFLKLAGPQLVQARSVRLSEVAVTPG